ncbi:MAG: hypothetical protein LUF82_01900 [Clostridia bacterium]|nr:hypothetical protein [Clostridia bacterium]
MAVATPVLERDTVRENFGGSNFGGNNFGSYMTADELHNACIKDNYAKLINPDYKLSDLVPQMENVVADAQPASYGNTAVRNVADNGVYLVDGARADSDLFRADSPLNRAFLSGYGAQAAQSAFVPEGYAAPVQAVMTEEEESEDLRPTSTTTQYRTIDANGIRISDSVINAYREGEISRPEEDADAHSRITFSKREKVIMGVILGLILSVFVLIIVNSAIISGINSDIASLDTRLDAAQQTLTETMDDLDEAMSYDSVYNYAVQNGIID